MPAVMTAAWRRAEAARLYDRIIERVGKENPVDYGHLGYCEGLRDGFRSGELRCSPDELERIRVLAAGGS